ncbi:MAG: HrpE/YscL family type III secretion apparatus protein [Chlamydiota bacterium]
MSNNLFSLIHGNEIHLAPKQKIIPSEQLQTILDAKGVLEKVQEDAIAYREEVTQECEALKEQAQKEGYEAGFQDWAEHILKFQKEIGIIRQEYVKMLAPVALKATQKIVGKAFELSNDLIYQIVENALKPVLQHKHITVYVNREDVQFLEEHREDLKSLFESIEILSIREREDVAKGGCVIETEGGIINARLENQWAILEKAFEKLFEDLNPNIATEVGTPVKDSKPEEAVTEQPSEEQPESVQETQ